MNDSMLPPMDAISALNELDIAFISQRSDMQIRQNLIAFIPLLEAVEKLCRNIDAAGPEALLAMVSAIALLPHLADDALEKTTLARIGTVGEMASPALHEIVDTIPSLVARGTVLEIIAPGWTHSGRPVRQAKVIVSAGPEPAPEGI